MKLSGFFRWFSVSLVSLAVLAGLARAQTNLPHAQVGVAYSYQIVTSPAAPSGTVYGATGLPSGISINNSSGLISGTAAVGSAGSYSGIISIAPPGAGTNNLSYVLVVDAAVGTPAITSATTATATVGQSFTYTVTASNSPTSFNVGTLPAGLSFNSGTNQITDNGGTMVAGTYTVSLSANNAGGTGATTTLTITINPAGAVPVITSATTSSASAVLPAGNPPSFTVNYQIVATQTPVSYAATGLPLGVSINSSTGLISGTTTVQGIYTVGLTASNNFGSSSSVNLTLTVGSLSTITSASTAAATAGVAMPTFTLTANNSAQSFNVSGLPTGLSVNTTTGAITGTIASAGTYVVTVSANNGVGTGPSSTLTITVTAPSGGGGGGVSAPVITSSNTYSVVTNVPFTFAVRTSPAATSYSLVGSIPAGVSINTSTGVISGTATVTGAYVMNITATNSGGSAVSSFTLTVNSLPVATTPPQSTSVALGGSVTLSVTATGVPTPTYQWQKNGVAITGATGTSLTLANFQVSDAASYSVAMTNITGTVVSQAAAVGVLSTAKVVGSAAVVPGGEDVRHPNGNFYDQVLLSGTAATITADNSQITRISFIDLSDDIVQVEFSGPGTLTLQLDSATGPAAPVKYNQPGVTYMKGHASLIITGATEDSHLSVFSVGRMTAYDPTGAYDITKAPGTGNDPALNGNPIFKSTETYDGLADIGLISIASSNGKFGGIRVANASFFRTTGLTGIYAPGVAVQGPTFVGDISADSTATGVLVFGSTTDVRITGGDMLQLNNRTVQVDGITQISFTAGTKSGGQTLPAQTNRARFEKSGVDVTTQIVK
jgi:hypothetical protein